MIDKYLESVESCSLGKLISRPDEIFSVFYLGKVSFPMRRLKSQWIDEKRKVNKASGKFFQRYNQFSGDSHSMCVCVWVGGAVAFCCVFKFNFPPSSRPEEKKREIAENFSLVPVWDTAKRLKFENILRRQSLLLLFPSSFGWRGELCQNQKFHSSSVAVRQCEKENSHSIVAAQQPPPQQNCLWFSSIGFFCFFLFFSFMSTLFLISLFYPHTINIFLSQYFFAWETLRRHLATRLVIRSGNFHSFSSPIQIFSSFIVFKTNHINIILILKMILSSIRKGVEGLGLIA